MMLSSVSARSTATALLCALALMGCKPSLTRPESAPMPPRVACDMPPMATLPPIPALAWMDVWALQVMGLYEGEAAKRAAQGACMTKLRADGVIR